MIVKTEKCRSLFLIIVIYHRVRIYLHAIYLRYFVNCFTNLTLNLVCNLVWEYIHTLIAFPHNTSWQEFVLWFMP